MIIVSNIKPVDQVVLSAEADRSVCATLQKIAHEYSDDYEFAYTKRGDQNNDTEPDRPICEKMSFALADGFGDKIKSSSWLLK